MHIYKKLREIHARLEGPLSHFYSDGIGYNPKEDTWYESDNLNSKYPRVLANVYSMSLLDDFSLLEMQAALTYMADVGESLCYTEAHEDGQFILQQLISRFAEEEDCSISPEVVLLPFSGLFESISVAGLTARLSLIMPNPVKWTINNK